MKPTACVPGLAATSSPTIEPGPVIMLKTPGRQLGVDDALGELDGADRGEDAGTHTTALPAASAGAISSAGIVYGQFHGVITPTTPRGTR